MAVEGKGKLFRQGKAKTRFISIPSKVAEDSSFPFRDEEEVVVRIQGKKVVIEKA